MRKGRRGFSLVEVVCAMTVVTIISAVTIGLISSSNRVMSNSKLAVGAANEARSIIDCYTAAVIQARMVYIDDNNTTETVEGTEFKKFFEYIEKFHNGIREVRPDQSNYDVQAHTYTFYYNGKYELVNQSDAIIIMKLTFPTDDNGKTTQPKVTVSRYNSKTNKPEKTLFSN